MAIRIFDVCEQGFLLAAGPSPTHPSVTRGACSVGPGVLGIPGTPLCLPGSSNWWEEGDGCSVRLYEG